MNDIHFVVASHSLLATGQQRLQELFIQMIVNLGVKQVSVTCVMSLVVLSVFFSFFLCFWDVLDCFTVYVCILICMHNFFHICVCVLVHGPSIETMLLGNAAADHSKCHRGWKTVANDQAQEKTRP